MNKISLSIMAIIFLIAATARPIATSCDEALRAKVETHISKLEALDDVVMAKRVFSTAGAEIEEISKNKCPDYYGDLAEVGCTGGKVLIARLHSQPFYCRLYDSGPATVSFHYNEAQTSAKVLTTIPQSILGAKNFSISAGNE